VYYNDYVAPEITPGRGDALPHFSTLNEEDSRRGFWFACLPNFNVEVFADQMVLLVTYPVAPDETREELHYFVAGDEAATSERYKTGREKLKGLWDELNREDIGLLEQLQQGRRSVAFEGASMAPNWDATQLELSRLLLRLMSEEQQDDAGSRSRM